MCVDLHTAISVQMLEATTVDTGQFHHKGLRWDHWSEPQTRLSFSVGGGPNHPDPQGRAGAATAQLCGLARWALRTWRPPAALEFPEIPRRGLRTTGQRAAGVGSLDARGTPPPGSRWPKRRGPKPATGPASGVTYRHRTAATLGRRASPACPAPRPHQAWSGCLAQAWSEMGWNEHALGEPRGPQPRSKCRLSLGLGRAPPHLPLPRLGFHVYKMGGLPTGKKRKIDGDQDVTNLNVTLWPTLAERPHTHPLEVPEGSFRLSQSSSAGSSLWMDKRTEAL